MNKVHIDKLLNKIALGDNQAFEKLYIETRKGVFAFLYSYLQNYADTEDALQEVYLKVKLHISSYRTGTNGNAWLLQIAKNHALNIIAKNKRHKTEDIDNVVIPVQDDFTLNGGEITKLMQKLLSEEEQRILTLHILWSYKHREIAKMLNIPIGTITSKYKRALEKLKKALKEV